MTKIFCLGDSLTAGYGVAEEFNYPTRLQRIYDQERPGQIKVINAGVSGSTTTGAYDRLKFALRAKPDIVVLALGANDGLRGKDLPQVKKNLIKTIELAQENKIQVLLVGMKIPPNYGKAYSEAFEAIYPELARRYKLALVPFMLEGVAGRPELNQPDGIHPLAEGYQPVTQLIHRALAPLLP